MSLDREVYQALESVVGKENISDDPAICEADRVVLGRGKEFLRPAWVVLPGSTKDVQQIISICNKYKVPFIPFSTFMCVGCSPIHPNTVAMDLKRMDRLEIDEKNMYAICEPGVTLAALQIEAMKRGLWFMVTACGGQASVVASNCSFGMGPASYRHGPPYRRSMAIEWVLPDGEVLNLGTHSLGPDYFWGEGPGPDLRGLLRGLLGPFGGLGVVTKMAVKLQPWVCEPVIPSGISPNTTQLLPASRMNWYTMRLPTWERGIDAMYEIAHNELGAMLTNAPAIFVAVNRARGKGAGFFWESWKELGETMDRNEHWIRVLLVGFTSAKQLAYEEKVLEDIAADFDTTVRAARVPRDESFLICADTICANFVTEHFTSVELCHDSLDCCLKVSPSTVELVKNCPAAFDDYGYYGWLYMQELGHIGYYERLTFSNLEGEQELTELARKCTQRDIEMGCPTSWQDPNVLGPHWLNYDEMLRDVLKVYDPNRISNPPRPFDIGLT